MPALHANDSVSTQAPLRILIVDDDDSVREILADFVSCLGHEALVAANGGDGIARYEREHPDIVVTDLVMPRLSGWDVIAHVRRLDPRARIVIVTGAASSADVARARDASVGLLQKPIRVADLDAALRAAVGGATVD